MIESLMFIVVVAIAFFILCMAIKKSKEELKNEISKSTKNNLESLLMMLEDHKKNLDKEVNEIAKMYLDDITDIIVEYKDHLEIVGNFESYTGDEVIANLIRHTKSIIKNIEEFKNSHAMLTNNDMKGDSMAVINEK